MSTGLISMRTATIASIAGQIIAHGGSGYNAGKDIENIAVKIATKIMEAAEASASKENELQTAKDKA